MLRLFAALPVPAPVASTLRKLQKDLPGASWRPEENFHITLRFFGEVSPAQARDLDDLIGDIDVAPFELTLEGCGWFGRREPTAVWARVRETEELSGLAAACTHAARRLRIPVDRQPFTPHVTLAYCHATPLSDAQAWAGRHDGLRAGPWWPDAFHLYSSHARKGGASRYVEETAYPIGHPFAGLSGPEETY